jgi:hypothetical protein
MVVWCAWSQSRIIALEKESAQQREAVRIIVGAQGATLPDLSVKLSTITASLRRLCRVLGQEAPDADGHNNPD